MSFECSLHSNHDQLKSTLVSSTTFERMTILEMSKSFGETGSPGNLRYMRTAMLDRNVSKLVMATCLKPGTIEIIWFWKTTRRRLKAAECCVQQRSFISSIVLDIYLHNLQLNYSSANPIDFYCNIVGSVQFDFRKVSNVYVNCTTWRKENIIK